MKIVLDTNIVVSALLRSQGNPAQVLALAMAGAVQVCHDHRILAEYAEVLARRRFKFDAERVREVLTKLEVDGLSIDATDQRDLELPDADDEAFLAVALAGDVDYLVTGNLADYPAEKRRGCAVVSPAEFMEAWRKAKPQSG
jgi:putative PIN family toxin of toxin-antitoxin system